MKIVYYTPSDDFCVSGCCQFCITSTVSFNVFGIAIYVHVRAPNVYINRIKNFNLYRNLLVVKYAEVSLTGALSPTFHSLYIASEYSV